MSDYFSHIDKAERIRCREEDKGNFLLYNPRTDQLHMVGEPGKLIFDLCDGRSIDDVVREGCELLAGAGDPQEPGQVQSFLCALKKRDLVVMT